MEFLIDNWLWIALALASGIALALPQFGRGGANAVSPQEAVQLMNREKAVVIDVCEPGEFAAGHVNGSRNIPLGSLEGAKGVPTNKAQPVVLVCARGSRAQRAAAQLRRAGHEKVHVLAGGMAAWREAGLPVEKSA